MVPLVTFSTRNHQARKCRLLFAVCLPFGRRNNPQTEAKPYSIRQRRKAGKCKRTNEAATIRNSQQQHGSPLLTGGVVGSSPIVILLQIQWCRYSATHHETIWCRSGLSRFVSSLPFVSSCLHARASLLGIQML